jgi:hypothetical protein
VARAFFIPAIAGSGRQPGQQLFMHAAEAAIAHHQDLVAGTGIGTYRLHQAGQVIEAARLGT